MELQTGAGATSDSIDTRQMSMEKKAASHSAVEATKVGFESSIIHENIIF